jgi:hypothetical protein
MALWSVIVYGRTYEADFRFLAIPEDFTQEALKWASQHINGTTRSPKELEKNPCWSLFKNPQHCVIGVTCMVRELIGSDERYQYMTQDSAGRSPYIFVGYVAKIEPNLNWWDIPTYPKNIDFFKLLLEYVEPLWHLKDYHLVNKEINRFEYSKTLNHYDFRASSNHFSLNRYFLINPSKKQAFIWQDSDYNRIELWENTRQSLYFQYQSLYFLDRSISLCLGLAKEKDVLEGPFLNATTLDAQKFESRSRPMPQKQPNQEGNSSLVLAAPSYKKTTVLNRINNKATFISLLCLTGLLVTLILRRWTMAIVISGIMGFYLGMLVERKNHKSKNFPRSKRPRKSSRSLQKMGKNSKPDDQNFHNPLG